MRMRGSIIYHAIKQDLAPRNVKCTFNDNTDKFELRHVLNSRIDWINNDLLISDSEFNKWSASYENFKFSTKIAPPSPNSSNSSPTVNIVSPPTNIMPPITTPHPQWHRIDLPFSWPSHIPLNNHLQSSPPHTTASPPPPSSLQNKSIYLPINSSLSPMVYCPKYTPQTTPSKIYLQPNTSLNNRLLKLATINIQSVRNKTDIIIDLMHDLNIDILQKPIISSLNTK